MMITARQITDAATTHGEGPVWSDAWNAFRFLDMLAGDILQLQPDGQIDRRSVGALVAVTRPRAGGGWMCVTDHGILTTTGDSLHSPLTHHRDLWQDSTVRPNEGGCAPDGSLLIGSMGWNAEPGRGELLQVSPQGELSTVLSHVGVSNGIGWTSDGHHAYYVDSATGSIDRFDWSEDTGLTGRQEWTAVTGTGSADGLAVDAAGGVWVAIYGAGEIHHYRPDGHLDDVVALPTSQPTSLAFGGPGRDRLIVTTSAHGLSHPDPAAGAVFELTNHDAIGAPTHPFAG